MVRNRMNLCVEELENRVVLSGFAGGGATLSASVQADLAKIRMDEQTQVLRRRGGRDAQLFTDEIGAHPVLEEVSIHLGREVPPGVLEPRENLQSTRVSQRLECRYRKLTGRFVVSHNNEIISVPQRE